MILLLTASSERRGPMETFGKLFGSLLALVYHCFDRVVHGAADAPRAYRSFLPRRARCLPHHQAGFGPEDPRLSALGRSFRAQPPLSHRWPEKGIKNED